MTHKPNPAFGGGARDTFSLAAGVPIANPPREIKRYGSVEFESDDAARAWGMALAADAREFRRQRRARR
jgi:hypothetical protein